MVNLQKFRTLVDLLSYFNTEQVCRDYLEQIRWDAMLSNIAMTLPYKQLIANEQPTKPVFRDTDTNNNMEVKQGRFSF